MKPIVAGIHEAKTNFSKLVNAAARGREVIIAKRGRPVARIVAYTQAMSDRKPGLLAGRVRIDPGFDELSPEFDALDG